MRSWIVPCLVLLWSGGEARSHGPAPAPLELLTVADAAEGSAPSLIRLNIGLARASGASWVYGCPSQFGDAETARMAATDDGALLVAVGGGEAYASTDAGCSFDPVDRADAQELYALRASADGDGVWLLAGDASAEEGAVQRMNSAGALEETRRMVGADRLLPDSLVPWAVGARSGVLVAGAAPSPTIVQGERMVTDAGVEWVWSSWPLTDLPDGVAFLRITRPEHDGRFWLVVTDISGRALWRVSFTPGTAPALSLSHAPAATLKGPVRLGARHLALFDGELKSAAVTEDSEAWSSLGPSPWTCLDERADQVYACSLTRLERLVDDAPHPWPGSEPIFLLNELTGPDTACMSADAGLSCFADWVHFGAEAGLLTPSDADQPPSSASTSGPDCSSAPSSGWGALALGWICGLAWSRRRKAC